jgi:succinate dehydrogenase/fumarate reductase flavoprotein subunit
MTTVNGLFAAGDGVGASGHKFSSGSFTEGKIAGKSAVAYVYPFRSNLTGCDGGGVVSERRH